MADFTKTITNAVNLFGLNPSNKWGESVLPYTMTWGVTKWGEDSYPQIFSVIKYASSSISPDTVIVKSPQKVIDNSFSVLSDPSSEQLSVGVWNVVFASDTTEAENRDFPTWAQSAAVSVSFTCAAAGSTTWS